MFKGFAGRAVSAMLDGDWHEVVSSWIAAARWDRMREVLWIRTRQGREYSWVQECGRALARGFFSVFSKGKWIWRNAPPGTRGLGSRGKRRPRRGMRR